MININDAYESLSRAKYEEEVIEKQKNKLLSIYYFLLEYCKKNPKAGTVKQELQRQLNKKESVKESFKFAIIGMLGPFGIPALSLILIYKYLWMIIYFILAAIGLSIYIGKNIINDKHTVDKNLKSLTALEEYLQDKDIDRSLLKLIPLIERDIKAIDKKLDEQHQAIEEYEDILTKANERLAEEVLEKRGITADVDLHSSMKILSKSMK